MDRNRAPSKPTHETQSDELDRLMPLTEATAYIPGRHDRGTIWRWATHGTGGVRLEVRSVGRRLYTTRRWLARFMADCESERLRRLREGRRQPATPARLRCPTEDAAREELRAAGVG